MKMEITINRENNIYNKSMKWHLVVYNENGGKFSFWYKTEKEAIYNKNRIEMRDREHYTRSYQLNA